MPKIEWKINIGNPSDYQKGALQKNAHKLEMPKTMNEMQKRALPFVIPAIFIIFISMFFKTKTNIEINGFLFGLSFLGLTSPCVDGYNVFQALRQTKEGDYLQFYGDDLYAFSGNL